MAIFPFCTGICIDIYLPSIREVDTQVPGGEDSYLYIYRRQLLGRMDGWGRAAAALAQSHEIQKAARECPAFLNSTPTSSTLKHLA